jgi:hypothetical protein
MPYFIVPPVQPRISRAPRLADRKASPATQLELRRPAMKKSSPVLVNFRRYSPIPMIATKYRTMMIQSMGAR